jgi:DNA-binding NarL/FixJ family response regulator
MTKRPELNLPFEKLTPRTEARQTDSHVPEFISIVCESPFELDLLGNLLRHVFPQTDIRCFETATQWDDAPECNGGKEVLLYSLGDKLISDDAVKLELRRFIAGAGDRRVIVTSHSKDMMAVFEAIECGAASFIPANAGMAELLEAIRADFSKCVVIPRASLEALRAEMPASTPENPGLERFFTERQLDVARALQRGDANKIIAYQLGLCESTVKVHIRNIMRKLSATNRTQAAYRLNQLANGDADIERNLVMD